MKPSTMSRKQLEAQLHQAYTINRRLMTMVVGLLLEYGDEAGGATVLKSTFALIDQGDHFETEPTDTAVVFRLVKGPEEAA